MSQEYFICDMWHQYGIRTTLVMVISEVLPRAKWNFLSSSRHFLQEKQRHYCGGRQHNQLGSFTSVWRTGESPDHTDGYSSLFVCRYVYDEDAESCNVVSLSLGIRRQQTQIIHDSPGGQDPGWDLHREGESMILENIRESLSSSQNLWAPWRTSVVLNRPKGTFVDLGKSQWTLEDPCWPQRT